MFYSECKRWNVQAPKEQLYLYCNIYYDVCNYIAISYAGLCGNNVSLDLHGRRDLISKQTRCLCEWI